MDTERLKNAVLAALLALVAAVALATGRDPFEAVQGNLANATRVAELVVALRRRARGLPPGEDGG